MLDRAPLQASILVLADDLTGALEAAAKFAEHDFRVRLITRPGRLDTGAVTVADTESRHLSREEAAAAVCSFATAPVDILYKKTDSALRGNISAELRALHHLFPAAKVSYIPSYPELGRTTRSGELLIDRVPVHLSNLADDALNPVTTSTLADIVRGIPCIIHDGETAEDIGAAVASALAQQGPHILAGPASVAAAIAAHEHPERVGRSWPKIETCLIVNGSRHPRSADQIIHAGRSLASGWRVLDMPRIENSVASEFAAQAGSAVVRELARSAPQAILIFGGDTAFAILEAMDRPDLNPIGEVLPGVPISKVADRELHFITKAGSFGDIDVIDRLQRLLNGNQ